MEKPIFIILTYNPGIVPGICHNKKVLIGLFSNIEVAKKAMKSHMDKEKKDPYISIAEWNYSFEEVQLYRSVYDFRGKV